MLCAAQILERGMGRQVKGKGAGVTPLPWYRPSRLAEPSSEQSHSCNRLVLSWGSGSASFTAEVTSLGRHESLCDKIS